MLDSVLRCGVLTKPRREPRYFWWAGSARRWTRLARLAMQAMGDRGHQVQDPGLLGCQGGSSVWKRSVACRSASTFELRLITLRYAKRTRCCAEGNVNGDEMSGSNLILVWTKEPGTVCAFVYPSSSGSKGVGGTVQGPESTAGSAVLTQDWEGSRRTWVWGHRHHSGSPHHGAQQRRIATEVRILRHSGPLHLPDAGQGEANTKTPARSSFDLAIMRSCDQACHPLTRDTDPAYLLRSLQTCQACPGLQRCPGPPPVCLFPQQFAGRIQQNA